MFDLRTATIVSGGQTGADRAALDFAIEFNIPYDGWCPKDRRDENGSIPACYQMRETPSRNYAQRTRWNVRDSDATILFTMTAELTGGTALAADTARRMNKPTLHLHPIVGQSIDLAVASAADQLVCFAAENRVSRLNIAGPRASQQPAIAAFVRRVLVQALQLGAG